MDSGSPTGHLAGHLAGQSAGLCRLTGVDQDTFDGVVRELLGASAHRPLAAGPVNSSDIADDHTPIEYSVAFQPIGPPVLRLLAEALPAGPGVSHLDAGYDFLRRQSYRPGLRLDRLDRVWDLFATDRPQGAFGIWHSVVFRGTREPEFKIYLNPEIHGVRESTGLVADAFDRIGMPGALDAVRAGLRPGELGGADRLAFFALDLHDGPRTRVKLYVAHHRARLADIERAAAVVPDVDADAAVAFCAAAGGTETFDDRPLISSYTLAPDTGRLVGYSVYVPIRGYVRDDTEARDRTLKLLSRHGAGGGEAEHAIDAVARRPLADGVGLIAHVSLRLGRPQPGVTVYLSAEAYRVSPPRPAPVHQERHR